MKVFAISDLHLSFGTNKPMDIFGEKWENYENKIKTNVDQVVGEDDVLLIAGDLSWAMNMAETSADFNFIGSLAGKKIVVRGNHDYWWKSISGVREQFEPYEVYALQNDSVKIGNVVIAGTRGWVVPERGKGLSEQDKKIYDRELIRLEMALVDATNKLDDDDKLIVLIHYPPYNSTVDDSDFTALLEKYKVDYCVYGHLHGKTKYSSGKAEKNGVKYILSSCDKIGFSPILICE